MPKSLPEYLDWLDERRDLIFPRPPAPKPIKATPYLKPLTDIRAVAWSVYGTLLTIGGGRLYHLHPQALLMQIALDKTIQEFNMWHSMNRKPGKPWETLLPQYQSLVEKRQMAGTRRKGDFPEVDSQQIWLQIIERLRKNEYQYDASFYGDPSQLAERVACFFHISLQGVAAGEEVAQTLRQIAAAGFVQGVIDDAQSFTVPQLLHALGKHGSRPTLTELFTPACLTLSCKTEMRKPSLTLFSTAAEQFEEQGLAPQNVLYISHRLQDDLAIARQTGFRTALLVADANCSQVTLSDVRDPQLKPDRLLTSVGQVLQILRL